MAIGPFIPPKGTPPTPKETPKRPMIEEVVATETHEFPRERGTPATTAPVAQPAARAPVNPATPAVFEKSFAEVNPEFFTIDLPSVFQFYDFKSLSCRTLLAAHQAKFSRAAKEQKLRYTVEGMSATLEPGKSAFDLTVADFYFLMYWQRVNSFSKNPMIVTAYCDNEQHNEDVHIGHEEPDPSEEEPNRVKVVTKDEATLKNEVLLNSTLLETKYAESVDVSDLEVARKYALYPETMRDVVETTELVQDSTVTEEDLFLIQYAVFVRRQPGQMTLRERMNVVASMSPDDMIELDKYIDRVTNYGVAEYANVKCKECSASMRVKISLDALMFLPGGR